MDVLINLNDANLINPQISSSLLSANGGGSSTQIRRFSCDGISHQWRVIEISKLAPLRRKINYGSLFVQAEGLPNNNYFKIAYTGSQRENYASQLRDTDGKPVILFGLQLQMLVCPPKQRLSLSFLRNLLGSFSTPIETGGDGTGKGNGSGTGPFHRFNGEGDDDDVPESRLGARNTHVYRLWTFSLSASWIILWIFSYANGISWRSAVTIGCSVDCILWLGLLWSLLTLLLWSLNVSLSAAHLLIAVGGFDVERSSLLEMIRKVKFMYKLDEAMAQNFPCMPLPFLTTLILSDSSYYIKEYCRKSSSKRSKFLASLRWKLRTFIAYASWKKSPSSRWLKDLFGYKATF